MISVGFKTARKVRVAIYLALLTLTVFTLSSCATQQEDPNRVSTIPWNRPESWEGKGGLGGFSPGTN